VLEQRLIMDGWLWAMTPGFDRDSVSRHLELANKHVADGQRRVEAQLNLVIRLERDGHDTGQAKRLLEQFEQILALQLQTRDRILQELGES
jgi:hypothetical protein